MLNEIKSQDRQWYVLICQTRLRISEEDRAVFKMSLIIWHSSCQEGGSGPPLRSRLALRHSPIVSKIQRGVMTAREFPGKARALRHLHGLLDGVVTICSLLGHSCHTGVHIQFLRSTVPAGPCLPAAATKARSDSRSHCPVETRSWMHVCVDRREPCALLPC